MITFSSLLNEDNKQYAVTTTGKVIKTDTKKTMEKSMEKKTDLFDKDLVVKNTAIKNQISNLRHRAEKKLASEKTENLAQDHRSFSQEALKTIHELQVYQIELEMQNEELLHTQIQLENAKKCYSDLYDMAPVGYCTLSEEGLILKANLAASNLFSQERNKLISQPISNFIFKEDQDIYYLFIKNLSKQSQSCELRMVDDKGKQFWVYIVVTSEKSDNGEFIYRLIINDITQHKEKEDLERSNSELRAFSRHLDAVREEERKFIAREIHDELGQLITALKIDLIWFKNKLASDSNLLNNKIKDMVTLTDLCIKSIRKISENLRPFLLDDLGLEAAMQSHANKYIKSMNIIYHLNFKLDEKILSKALGIVLFRIYQEALTNIIRYAQASKIIIDIAQKNKEIIMNIEDNGIGITTEDINNPKSFGLQGMKERLSPWQGKINIIGVKGKGTKVHISIPSRIEGDLP